MKHFLVIPLILFFLFSFRAEAQEYKQVKIYLDDFSNDIAELVSYGFDVTDGAATKDRALVLFLTSEEFAKLQSSAFRYEVLIEDWHSYYESLPELTDAEKYSFMQQSKQQHNIEGFEYGSMGGFYTFAEIVQELDSMRQLYPNLITAKEVIGYSVENRPVYMVKISDNPEAAENEPQVLYTALIHAREPAGMMAVLYYMYYLLENYGTDPAVTYLVDNREIYFIPVVNPDGYEYNRQTDPNGGGMWRKNRSNNGGSYGVDLNRNWGPYEYWNAPNGGSSTTPSSSTYRGPSPFSEPELVAVRDWIDTKNIKAALNYHTYSNLLIYPYGALGHETPDSALFREYARDMTAWNGYTYGTDLQTVGYSTRGNSDDYLYDGDTTNRGKIFAMTPEVGGYSDGFWPSQARIFPLAQENLMPNYYYSWVAGDYVSYTAINYGQNYFRAGDEVNAYPVMKNKGLSDAQNITVEMTSLSPYVTMTSTTASFGTIPSRGEVTASVPVSFTIAGDTPVESVLQLLLETYTGGVLMSSDTVSIITGVPNYAFVDTTNDPTNLWTITANPVNPHWEFTAGEYYSAPGSYTDSKTGDYEDDATVTMTTTNPIDLSTFNAPILSFWTKYNIEATWDCGVIRISTDDGSSWQYLEGALSVSASGSGKQKPAGIPVYDDVQSEWFKEEIDLSAYAGTSALLSFELRTDGYISRDGWYLDDIAIMVYADAMLTSFNDGGTFYSGTEVNISWNGANVNSLDIFYSDDNGATWNSIAEDVDFSSGSYLWTIPYTMSEECLIKVVDPSNTEITDVSSQTFGINTIATVTYPTAGSAFMAGSEEIISWTNNTSLTNISIEYSTDNGINWQTIIASYPASGGSYTWTVPDTPGDEVLLRISDAANNSAYALSGQFSIVPLTPVPLPYQPANNAIDVTTEVTFVWKFPFDKSKVTVDNYWFELSDDSLFTSFIHHDSTLTDTTVIVSGLNYMTKYFWRVKAKMNGNWGNFTTTYKFTTMVEPVSAPDGLTALATVPGEVNLQWTDNVTNEEGFIIERKEGDSTSSSSYAVLDSVGANETSFTDTSVPDSIAEYTYRILAYNSYTVSAYSNQATVTTVTAVQDGSIPDQYALKQNYPNPFNPSTTIRFELPEAGNVTLEVYDILGNKTDVLVSGYYTAGRYEVDFDASNLSSGIYFYSIQANNFRQINKMLLLK